MDEKIILSPSVQLEIFEKVFLESLEYLSLRWKLKEIIASYDRVDNAELNLKLRKLELEIIRKRKGGERND